MKDPTGIATISNPLLINVLALPSRTERLVALNLVPRLTLYAENTSSALKKTPPAIEAYPPTRGRTVPITAVGAIGGMPGRRREESQRPPVDRGFLRTQTGQLLCPMLLKFQIVLVRRMLEMSINS
jgi:hypothetical protein